MEQEIAETYPDYYQAVKDYVDTLPDPRPKETVSKMKKESWNPWQRLYTELSAISSPQKIDDRAVFDQLAAGINLRELITEGKASKLEDDYPTLFSTLQAAAPLSYASYVAYQGRLSDAVKLVDYDPRLVPFLRSEDVVAFYAHYLGLEELLDDRKSRSELYGQIIRQAIKMDDLKTVEYLFDKTNVHSMQLLNEAIKHSTRIALYLIASGVKEPGKALNAAISANNVEVAEVLLQRYGKELMINIWLDEKPILLAAKHKNWEMVRLLVRYASLHTIEKIWNDAIANDNAPLARIVAEAEPSHLRHLARAIASRATNVVKTTAPIMLPHAKQQEKNTLLSKATVARNEEVVAFLLDLIDLPAEGFSFVDEIYDKTLTDATWEVLENDPRVFQRLEEIALERSIENGPKEEVVSEDDLPNYEASLPDDEVDEFFEPPYDDTDYYSDE